MALSTSEGSIEAEMYGGICHDNSEKNDEDENAITDNKDTEATLGSCSSGTSSRVDVIQMGLYMSFILYLI
jgi:hypothetical protein